MKYYIVDAFTREAFGGNPAGVVLVEGDFPADTLMQQVAAELRYSETAFVQQNGPNEFTLRYFTPAGEVKAVPNPPAEMRHRGTLLPGPLKNAVAVFSK